MGVNDAAEMLAVAQRECARLERENRRLAALAGEGPFAHFAVADPAEISALTSEVEELFGEGWCICRRADLGERVLASLQSWKLFDPAGLEDRIGLTLGAVDGAHNHEIADSGEYETVMPAMVIDHVLELIMPVIAAYVLREES